MSVEPFETGGVELPSYGSTGDWEVGSGSCSGRTTALSTGRVVTPTGRLGGRPPTSERRPPVSPPPTDPNVV